MGIEVDTKIDFTKIGKDLGDNLEKTLGRAMQETLSDIKIKTSQGRDIEGRPFARFADSYTKRLKKLGRAVTPTLRFSGQMMDSIQTKIERTVNAITGIIYSLPGRVNKYGNATNTDLIRYNNETRPFFGLSNKQVKNILNKLRGK